MIVGVWLAALGWLVWREYRPGAGAGVVQAAAARLPPTTVFLELFAGRDAVGLHSVSTDTLPDGLRVTSRTDVDVPLPLVPRRVLVTTEALYDPTLRLRSYTHTVSGEAGQLTIVGAVTDDTLLTLIATGRGLTTADTLTRRIANGALLRDAVPLALAARGALRGPGSVEIEVLDPESGVARPRVITASAESTFVVADSAIYDSTAGTWRPSEGARVTGRRIAWRDAGQPVTAWVDPEGAWLQVSTPLGLDWERAPFEIANSGYRKRRPRNVQAAPLEVAVSIAAPAGPTWVGLGPVDLRTAATALTTPWQSVVRDGIATRRGPAVPRRMPAIPDSIAATDRRPLASPRIKVEARRIVGHDSIAPGEAIARLARWIGGAVVPGTPGIGGAEQTLLRRRGDSSDRAELMVAMARALGIPARSVAGLLASDGRLRYRAWVEVWIGGWVPADPSLGQFPADGGHVRLLVHASARPSELVPLVGAVRPQLATTTPEP